MLKDEFRAVEQCKILCGDKLLQLRVFSDGKLHTYDVLALKATTWRTLATSVAGAGLSLADAIHEAEERARLECGVSALTFRIADPQPACRTSAFFVVVTDFSHAQTDRRTTPRTSRVALLIESTSSAFVMTPFRRTLKSMFARFFCKVSKILTCNIRDSSTNIAAEYPLLTPEATVPRLIPVLAAQRTERAQTIEQVNQTFGKMTNTLLMAH